MNTKDNLMEISKQQCRFRIFITCQITTLCMAALSAAPAFAQTPTEVGETGYNTGKVDLEEIIVTACKREESLQIVPISISAYFAADLERIEVLSGPQGTLFSKNTSGGLNGDPSKPTDFIAYDPEFIWIYEVGLRSDLLDRRLRFDASGIFSGSGWGGISS